MPGNYCVELDVSYPWNCEICLCAKPTCSHLMEGPKLAALCQHLPSHPHTWAKHTKCYTDLILCIFGGGITIVNGSSQVGTAPQKAPFLLYNLQKDFFFQWQIVLQYYTGCHPDLLGSQTCSCKMVNHLEWSSKTCPRTIFSKSKCSKPCHFGLPKDFQFVAGVSWQYAMILHANGHC